MGNEILYLIVFCISGYIAISYLLNMLFWGGVIGFFIAKKGRQPSDDMFWGIVICLITSPLSIYFSVLLLIIWISQAIYNKLYGVSTDE